MKEELRGRPRNEVDDVGGMKECCSQTAPLAIAVKIRNQRWRGWQQRRPGPSDPWDDGAALLQYLLVGDMYDGETLVVPL